MPRGAKPGERRGGRAKGTPNKDKQSLLQLIQQKFPGYHPVIAMAEIANSDDETVDLNTRFQAHKEVAQYVEPKRKAVEHSGEGGGPVKWELVWMPSE